MMVRAIVLALWAYYLVFSLAAPPIVTDAHLYDLARLYIIRQGGLFHNDAFAYFTQQVFPWTFDAVHWPLVCVGMGYALPSFACFSGMLVVTFLSVRDACDDDVAWLAVLALFALPTLVYQATSVKSDIAVLFGVFCWFHAMRRFRGEGRIQHLAWGALALAFAGGAKTSALPLTAGLGVASLWFVRGRPRLCLFWVGSLLGAGLLFCSVETYAATLSTYGNLLGPESLSGLRNSDGVRGAVANAIRHLAFNVDLGTDVVVGRKWVLSSAMERWCNELLDATGLSHRGLAVWSGDRHVDFLKSGHEAQDGYGPLGTLAMLLAPVILIRRRPSDWAWRLTAAGVATFALSAYAIGFTLWVNRFLMLPFTLGSLAAVLYLAPAWERSGAVRASMLAILVYSAVVLPAFSFGRKPIDIWRSIRERDVMLTREMPVNLPVLRAVRASMAACPTATWVVTTYPIAAQFLFYDLLRDREIVVRPRRVTAAFLSDVQRAHGGHAVHVLAVGEDLPPIPGLKEVQTFASEYPKAAATHLYRYGDDGCAGAA